MSRSRRKFAKIGFCAGSNTEYYRDRNRDTRRRNKMNLHNLFAKKQLEDIADEIYTIRNKENTKFDRWTEPTDGSHIVWESDEFWDREKYLRK